MVLFDECEHQWDFEKSAEAWNWPHSSLLTCKSCFASITLEEKCTLEQTEIAAKAFQDQKESSEQQLQAQEKSLKIQEKNLRIAMWAMVISAISSFIALCIFLFGDKTLFL